MKNCVDMTNDKICFWLDKTGKSLGNAVNSSEQRKFDLIDRYEELKEEALKRNIWHSWCEKNCWSPSHDAYDCLA